MKIRTSLKKFAGATFAFAFLALSTSCNDDESTPPMEQQKTIANIVSENADYSLLKAAVTKANLGETLNGTGPFTVFAPNNQAFAASGISQQTINSLSETDLSDILLYHTLGSKVMATNVPAGPNAEVTTVGGDKIYVTKDSRGVFVNGWKVTTADIAASNGVIHSIERVLMPPTQNIVQMAQANPNLTYLVAAVLRASEGSTNVANVLATTNNLTVFAPTNEAFIDAGFPTIASIQSADPATLTSILTYHVIAARAFSSDLSNGQSLNTVNGGTLMVALGSQATVKGNSNSTPSTITSVNMLATNGVVHLIDRVLLP
ncbi:fasciclin domain-containing protein [Paenimyroides viscosum]|uniref:Fasciclin domain-containing protein n=1 Tax=Paenimyroides viscosum TaxID=2488729 RepID=A0A3P1ASP9_9FLAO|nr:fasciclin domain-containing protein [Paenimyroides viscosum]RRA91991.1 fasciclin domain-containing protein [Paenimyroides viscosum]